MKVSMIKDEKRFAVKRRMLGSNIKKQIEKNGMLQKTVAAEMGISQTAMSLYCTGRESPSFPALCKLAGILRCTPADLLEGIEGGLE